MKKILVILFVFVCTCTLQAQKTNYEKYWLAREKAKEDSLNLKHDNDTLSVKDTIIVNEVVENNYYNNDDYFSYGRFFHSYWYDPFYYDYWYSPYWVNPFFFIGFTPAYWHRPFYNHQHWIYPNHQKPFVKPVYTIPLRNNNGFIAKERQSFNQRRGYSPAFHTPRKNIRPVYNNTTRGQFPTNNSNHSFGRQPVAPHNNFGTQFSTPHNNFGGQFSAPHNNFSGGGRRR